MTPESSEQPNIEPSPSHKPGDVFHPTESSPMPTTPTAADPGPAMAPLPYNQSANEVELERTKEKKGGRILLVGGGIIVAVGLSLLGYYGVQQARSRFLSTSPDNTAFHGLVTTTYKNGQGDVFELPYYANSQIVAVTSLSALGNQATSASKPNTLAILAPPAGEAELALATIITRSTASASSFESSAVCTSDYRFSVNVNGSTHKVCGVKGGSNNAQLIYLTAFESGSQNYVVTILLNYNQPKVLADKTLAQQTIAAIDLTSHDNEIKQILVGIKVAPQN